MNLGCVWFTKEVIRQRVVFDQGCSTCYVFSLVQGSNSSQFQCYTIGMGVGLDHYSWQPTVCTAGNKIHFQGQVWCITENLLERKGITSWWPMILLPRVSCHGNKSLTVHVSLLLSPPKQMTFSRNNFQIFLWFDLINIWIVCMIRYTIASSELSSR
jgi:hypothetical protein